MASNLLDDYPSAKKTKLPGLFIAGKDSFLIQVKASYYGTTCGWQGTFSGSFKEAIIFWKDKRKECYRRAKSKRMVEARQRLLESGLRIFK